MTYTVERIAGGTFTGPGVSPGGTTASFTTDGPNRLAVAVIFTGRQQNGGNDYHRVASMSGGGVTWNKVVNEDFTYQDTTASGSFPDNYQHCDVFFGVAATQQTGATLTFTMASAADNFVNVGWAVVFTIDGGLTTLDGNASNMDVTSDLSVAAASAIALAALDTDSSVPFVMAIMFGHKKGGGTNPVTIPSGFATAGSVSGNAKFDATGSGAGCECSVAVAFKEYASAQSALSLTSGSSHDAWFALPLVFVPAGTDGNATGSTLTATSSVIGGTAAQVVDGNASGVTLEVDASLSTEGVATEAAEIDGSTIFEISFTTTVSAQYSESDYDSIYSVGSRWQNGLITLTEIDGLTNGSGAIPGGAFDNSYGSAGGSGWNPQGQGALNMEFQTGLMLAGMRFIGASTLAERTASWQLLAGMGPGDFFEESYAQEFDLFKTSQNQSSGFGGLHWSELLMTPRLPIEYTHYQFKLFPITQTASGERFAEEIEFKVFHSILDGGDRRSTNGRAAKQVTITLSSDWVFDNTSGHLHPTNAWLDGSYARLNAPGVTETQSLIGKSGLAPQDIVGAYIQFDYPRPVIQQHLVLHSSLSEVYSGGNPTRFGKWHWEYSKNGGVSWTAIGGTWWFHEDTGNHLLAPHTGTSFGIANDTTLGTGAKQWRMVLDAGPAFGGSFPITEIQFNVIDSEELTSQVFVAFTDDTDGTLVTATIGIPGSPYVVAFSDGTDDALTLNVSNTPNPVLTVAFTDDSTFDTWSDLYPSVIVQTVVVATGMA